MLTLFRNLVIHSTAVGLSAHTHHPNTFLPTDKHLCSNTCWCRYKLYFPLSVFAQWERRHSNRAAALNALRDTFWHCVWRISQSLNGWLEGRPGSHWQEGKTQALTCKMGISTHGVTFSMKSRHLAQRHPGESGSDRQSRFCARMCV